MNGSAIMKKKQLILAVAGVLSIMSLAACSSNKALVSLKGGDITQEDYYNEIKATSTNQQAFQQMVIYKVAEEGYGDKVTDKAVNKQYNSAKKQYGDSFTTLLKQYGYTKSSYKDTIRNGLYFEAMLKANLTVSDKELKAAWKEYHPEVSAQIIKADSEDDANAILKEIKAGGDFTKLAKEKSTDTTTNEDGGKVSFDSTDTTIPTEVQTAAFALKDGAVSEVITSTVTDSSTYAQTTSYYIVKMTKNKDKGNSMKPYKKTIKKIVEDSKLSDSTFQTKVIKKELKKADVVINDDDLKDALSTYTDTSSSSTSDSSSSKKKSSSSTTKEDSSETTESTSAEDSSSK